jgi:hypothetical protein
MPLLVARLKSYQRPRTGLTSQINGLTTMIVINRRKSVVILVRFLKDGRFGVLLEQEAGVSLHELDGQLILKHEPLKDATEGETPVEVIEKFRWWAKETTSALH